ncbi:MAG TPA: DUF4157 domain-containing protein [Pseudonocardiaceae bacterium]|nr:DUF4157 domain-containing protein [Pseudonocardiaceae bacterium]
MSVGSLGESGFGGVFDAAAAFGESTVGGAGDHHHDDVRDQDHSADRVRGDSGWLASPIRRPSPGDQPSSSNWRPSSANRPVGLGAPLTRPLDNSHRTEPASIADVPVHRGPAVDAHARALRARAFTRDGEIYLPETANAATLAHELTHVVQQRALGPSLPTEWSAEGRVLERQAVAAEQHAAPPLIHRAPEPPPVESGVQRQPDLLDEPQATEIASELPPPEPPTDPLAAHHDKLIALCAQRSVDMNDARDIGELATKLYHPLRGLLRAELLVDRERAGLLTDFR